MTANKEIESLRIKLEEASVKIETDTKEKQTIQDDLKRAFVRGLCSMNQDAMNILGFMTPRNDSKEPHDNMSNNYSPSNYDNNENIVYYNNRRINNKNSPSIISVNSLQTTNIETPLISNDRILNPKNSYDQQYNQNSFLEQVSNNIDNFN